MPQLITPSGRALTLYLPCGTHSCSWKRVFTPNRFLITKGSLFFVWGVAKIPRAFLDTALPPIQPPQQTIPLTVTVNLCVTLVKYPDISQSLHEGTIEKRN